jgi:hypothetical protein
MLIWVKCGLGFRFKLIANFVSFFGSGTGGHIRASRFISLHVLELIMNRLVTKLLQQPVSLCVYVHTSLSNCCRPVM